MLDQAMSLRGLFMHGTPKSWHMQTSASACAGFATSSAMSTCTQAVQTLLEIEFVAC